MTAKARIGLLTPGWPGHNTPNGIATAVYNLAMGLHDIGQTPVILTRNRDGEGPPEIPVVPVPDLSWTWQDRVRSKLGDHETVHRVWARGLIAAVRQAIAEHGLETLIIEETNGWAAEVCRDLSLPVIVTLHGPWVLHKSLKSLGPREDARREARERKGFEAAAGIIAPSRSVLEAVEAATALTNTPSVVLPNCILLEPDAPVAAHRKPRNILFVGRYDHHKGGDVVLLAFERLCDLHPEVRLTFVGPDRGLQLPDGSTRHMAEALAALPEAVRARVEYKGPVDRAGVSRLRDGHALALIASRYENLNYTLLEAMAAGQGIVCTDVGGPAEVLEQEATALLVPPDDPEAMAAALARMLDETDLPLRLGAAARAKVQQDFEAAGIAERVRAFVQTARAPFHHR